MLKKDSPFPARITPAPENNDGRTMRAPDAPNVFARACLRVSILRRAFSENMVELDTNEPLFWRTLESTTEALRCAPYLFRYSGHTLRAIHDMMNHPAYDVTGYVGYNPKPLPEQDLRNIAVFFDIIYDTTGNLSYRYHEMGNPYLETVRILAAALDAEGHDDLIEPSDYSRALVRLIASQLHWDSWQLRDDGVLITEDLKDYLREHPDRVEHLIEFLQRRVLTLEEMDVELLRSDHDAPALSLRDGML